MNTILAVLFLLIVQVVIFAGFVWLAATIIKAVLS